MRPACCSCSLARRHRSRRSCLTLCRFAARVRTQVGHINISGATREEARARLAMIDPGATEALKATAAGMQEAFSASTTQAQVSLNRACPGRLLRGVPMQFAETGTPRDIWCIHLARPGKLVKAMKRQTPTTGMQGALCATAFPP